VRTVVDPDSSGTALAVAALIASLISFGVVLMSFLQKENLIKSMVTGKKEGAIDQAIRSPVHLVGLMLAFAWVYLFYIVASGALPALTQ
jgi:hypothetical protein